MSRSIPSLGARGINRRNLELMEWAGGGEENKNAPTYRKVSVNLWLDGRMPQGATPAGKYHT